MFYAINNSTYFGNITTTEEEEEEGPICIQNFIFLLHTGNFFEEDSNIFSKNIRVNHTLQMPIWEWFLKDICYRCHTLLEGMGSTCVMEWSKL